MGTKITPPTTKFNLTFPLGFFLGGGVGHQRFHGFESQTYGNKLWHVVVACDA